MTGVASGLVQALGSRGSLAPLDANPTRTPDRLSPLPTVVLLSMGSGTVKPDAQSAPLG